MELKSDNNTLKTLLNIKPSFCTGGSTNGTKKRFQIGSGSENLRGFASHIFVWGSSGPRDAPRNGQRIGRIRTTGRTEAAINGELIVRKSLTVKSVTTGAVHVDRGKLAPRTT